MGKNASDSIVLGRTLSHDNSACILRGGRLVAAIATERLTRRKHDHSENDRAVLYCLDAAGITLDEVDVIVQNSPKHYFRAGNESQLIKGRDSRVWTISHHLAHAWAAFATGPFDATAVLVIDGRGNFVPPEGDVILPPGSANDAFHMDGGCGLAIEVESVYRAEGRNLELVHRNRSRGLPASIGSAFSRRPGLYPGEYSGYYQYAGLGAMYEQASFGLFGSGLDGGKVMGLAAFSEPDDRDVAKIIQVSPSDGSYKLGTQWLTELDGPVSVDDEFKRAAQIAANVQAGLELGVEAVVKHAHRITGERNLCYSGGVALNCLANEKIIRDGTFENVFIQPACNDAGASIGCAFFGHTCVLGGVLHHERYLDFNGVDHTSTWSEALAKWDGSVVARRLDDVVAQASELLCSGCIVGWYRGRSELGPRALGSRSILAPPHPESIKNRLNEVFKRREPFRPFAPVVPLESASRYFDIMGESPYMLRVVAVRPQYQSQLRAITHVDGTARVQTVCREDDPVLHRLLSSVGAELGIPVLLNTSYNKSGLPMVETPDDAIASFVTSGLDALFLGEWIVERRYSTTEAVRSKETQGSWRLAPGVEVFRRYTDKGEEAWIQQGPRRRGIRLRDAEVLSHLEPTEHASRQESRHPDPESFRRLLDCLFADGWVYASAASLESREGR